MKVRRLWGLADVTTNSLTTPDDRWVWLSLEESHTTPKTTPRAIAPDVAWRGGGKGQEVRRYILPQSLEKRCHNPFIVGQKTKRVAQGLDVMRRETKFGMGSEGQRGLIRDKVRWGTKAEGKEEGARRTHR